MVSLLESAPSAARLKELQGDAEGQIQHCFRVIAGDKDFADLGKLFKVGGVGLYVQGCRLNTYYMVSLQ